MFAKPELLIMGLALCSYVSCETNPVTGREELMLVPEDQDFEPGRKCAAEIESRRRRLPQGGAAMWTISKSTCSTPWTRRDQACLQKQVNSLGERAARRR
ncbi:MAG: hypothetical protein H8E73_02440 [Planctomycetes bacterium]|nr:hypothetical protein [Planctomycetota bacterium]